MQWSGKHETARWCGCKMHKSEKVWVAGPSKTTALVPSLLRVCRFRFAGWLRETDRGIRDGLTCGVRLGQTTAQPYSLARSRTFQILNKMRPPR